MIFGLTRHTDMAAVEWIVTMREGLRRMAQNPAHIHMLHYESLVADPRRELSTVLDFCELPNDGVFLDYARQKLAPPPKSQTFELHPAIRAPFCDTMEALGY